ncbi:MAG: hypothetical protein RMM53_10290 [Bacteroidia bacterium]|nr:hypothetical protein [Bacteroidia bacterium]
MKNKIAAALLTLGMAPMQPPYTQAQPVGKQGDAFIAFALQKGVYVRGPVAVGPKIGYGNFIRRHFLMGAQMSLAFSVVPRQRLTTVFVGGLLRPYFFRRRRWDGFMDISVDAGMMRGFAANTQRVDIAWIRRQGGPGIITCAGAGPGFGLRTQRRWTLDLCLRYQLYSSFRTRRFDSGIFLTAGAAFYLDDFE